MPNPATIVWFRQDLRLADNPVLQAAIDCGPIVPVFIWSPQEEGDWPPGGASNWWLHQSLQSLAHDLEARGSRLILRTGPALREMQSLLRETGSKAVYWNRRYEPAAIARDQQVKTALKQEGIAAESYNGSLLFEPWELQTKAGKPFQVFTPFWKACQERSGPAPAQPAPRKLLAPSTWPESLSVHELALEPKINWAEGIRAAWKPGETAAQLALQEFVEQRLRNYLEDRDRPAVAGTSRLSPYLHLGEISPRQIWHSVRDLLDRQGKKSVERGMGFLREIAWREFAYHLLFHFPRTPRGPLRADFARFPWLDDEESLRAWQRGRTGYPIVDAGLRELWVTGWMHNRVRMVVASFLVKHLLIPWQQGAAWFWDTLVDADLANNTLGWQWVAGCGADAAPYFRIFNPVLQGEKFDPEGAYVRRWLPELERVPNRYVHKPWEASSAILKEAGVQLGIDYPAPIVDHAEARQRALAAFERLSQQRR